MRLFEDVLPLHPEADQRVHVEEAAVPEFLVRGAPEGETEVLRGQHLVQRIDVAVQLRDGLVDGAAHAFFFTTQPLQQAKQHLLVTVSRKLIAAFS